MSKVTTKLGNKPKEDSYFSTADKSQAMEKYMLPCMNKWLFGVDCPGCGTQRALALIWDGEFVAAFSMFPAIYTTALLFVCILLHFLDRTRNYHKTIIRLAIFNGALTVIAYIYKMSHL